MKNAVLTGIMLLLAVIAQAQARLEIGLKGGVNMASVSGKDFKDAEGITSYHAGAYGLIKVAKIGIQPEVLFSNRGFEDDNGTTKFTYIDIPVMLKYYIAAGFNIQLGPQFSTLLKAKDFDGNSIRSDLKESEMGAAIGAGIDLPAGLHVNARYVLGLTDINEMNGGSKLKNNFFQVSLGYSLLKIGK
jgi:hypothetical protein